SKQNELKILFETVKEQKKAEPYKDHALVFLKELYTYHDFLEVYDQSILAVINKIKEDMLDLDAVFERQYVTANNELKKHPLAALDRTNLTAENQNLITDYQNIEQKVNKSLTGLAAHRWMNSKFNNYE